jgi:carbamoylphosphate synthase large subunit
MKTDDVLKEIRRVRKKHYEETKHMSITERMEYDRKKNEHFQKELEKIDANKYDFSFLYPKKENFNENKK